MEKQLSLYKIVSGEKVLFPSVDKPLLISAFSYSSVRMGGTPSITAKVMYDECLDNEWEGVFTEFNGERFYVKTTPNSSKGNADVRYEHNITLYSERFVLDNVYFIDAVQGNNNVDRYKSNSSKILFMGDIHEFASRLQSSLSYSSVPYTVQVDDDITSEEKLISFEDKLISEALQEAFTVYNIPYYFEGRVIHFGYTSNAITTPVEYGSDKALMTVNKTNANYRIVNRCTGVGSSDNLPYYYPNNSPKGNVRVAVGLQNQTLRADDVIIVNMERFSSELNPNNTIFYRKPTITVNSVQIEKYTDDGNPEDKQGTIVFVNPTSSLVPLTGSYSALARELCENPTPYNVQFRIVANVHCSAGAHYQLQFGLRTDSKTYNNFSIKKFLVGVSDETSLQSIDTDGHISDLYLTSGDHQIDATIEVGIYSTNGWESARYYPTIVFESEAGYYLNDKRIDSLDKYGVMINVTPALGDCFMQRIDASGYIQPCDQLMPPIYRETMGAERFYNALNNTYDSPSISGQMCHFDHPYTDGDAREAIVSFEDIKPSIVDMRNGSGQRIDQFLEVAFDQNDSDEFLDGTEEYAHPYFFVKLPKFNGQFGFNLFHCASTSAMTLSVTKGVCGGCEFEIGVGEESGKNIVQVDEYGNLKRDTDGRVLLGAPQDVQNDTRNNEVWIALKKDINTYPAIMPSKIRNLIPKAGDTFVLLNIQLPDAYILAAEDRLYKEILKYMELNNNERFTFSIGFSRIFFAQNPSFLEQLNENARIMVRYNEQLYTLYISSFKYEMSSGEVLPQISVDLAEELISSGGTLQKRIDAVKQDILSSVGSEDVLKRGLKYFVRKDVEDTANEQITFAKGLKVGNYTAGMLGSGGAITVDSYGNSTAEVDFLKVRRKAEFTEITIDELQSVGGSILLSMASMICSRVEEGTDYYRCYFEAKDNIGTTIENRFEVNDLARCQSFNASNTKYYWRQVVGVGADYIDLSKTICDTGSVAPSVGDKIVQMGNTQNDERQSVQLLSCYGNEAPSFIMYNGINSFSLNEKDIFGVKFDRTTKTPQFYSYGSMRFGCRENESGDFIRFHNGEFTIKAKVQFTSGSSGLENVDGWNNIDLTSEVYFSFDVSPEYSGVPKPNNVSPSETSFPTSNWNTADYATHKGALFYSKDCKTYEFSEVSNGVYRWVEIDNTDIAKILKKAKDANDLANSANELASGAQSRLESWMDDGVCSPMEVAALQTERQFVLSDYQSINSDIQRYGLRDTHLSHVNTYQNARQQYSTAIAETLESTPDENGNREFAWGISGYQEAFYTARTVILQDISAAIKELAETAASVTDIIASVDVEYAKGSSSTTAPTTGWSTSSPQWEAGKFIWQRTKTTYVDNTKSPTTSTPVCISGRDGRDGVGIVSIKELYYLTNVNIVPSPPSSHVTENGDIMNEWTTICPTWEAGYVYYTCSEILYEDGVYVWTDVQIDNNSRSRTFFTQEGEHPLPPYRVGDQWVCATGTFETTSTLLASYGSTLVADDGVVTSETITVTVENEILVCINGKELGSSFDIADWTPSGGYGKKSDYQYLVDCLPSGSTTDIYGGLVLGNILAVKNEQGKVVAMMNGLSTQSTLTDSAKGILMFASGITESVANAKNATTQIWSDGTIKSTKGVFENATVSGKITASSGSIGNFTIDTVGWLKAEGTNYEIGFSSAALYLKANVDVLSDTESILYQTTCHYRSDFNVTPNPPEFAESLGNSILNINSEVTYSGSHTPEFRSMGIAIDVKGSAAPFFGGLSSDYNEKGGNYAIYCTNGMYGGLRPKTRRIASVAPRELQLTEYDYNIVWDVNNGGALVFPTNPQLGQTYRIFKCAAYVDKTISVSASHPIVYHSYGRTDDGFNSINDDLVLNYGRSGVVEYVFDGNRWNCVALSIYYA